MENDVTIIGAGPVGLCLARSLALGGLRVALVERQPAAALAEPAFDGREIALTHGSMRLLRQLGVCDEIPPADIHPLRTARVTDGKASPALVVEAADSGHERLGNLVPNQRIRQAAWRAAQASNAAIHLYDGTAVESVHTDHEAALVELADGTRLQSRLLVAADSRFSQTRQAMGISAHQHDFGKSMLVCRLRHTQRRDAEAWEWFGTGCSRALLPLGEHLSSLVLTVPGGEAARLAELSAEAFTREMEQRLEQRLGTLELASTRHVYPLVAVYARRFSGTRFALAGDAAVGMHPVTAHGFNLGLASVERLTAAVNDGLARSGDPGDPAMLARYHRRHRRGTLPLFLATRTVVELYTNDHGLMQPLRKAALRASSGLPPFRRAIAAGLIDDGPLDPPLPLRIRDGLRLLRA